MLFSTFFVISLGSLAAAFPSQNLAGRDDLAALCGYPNGNCYENGCQGDRSVDGMTCTDVRMRPMAKIPFCYSCVRLMLNLTSKCRALGLAVNADMAVLLLTSVFATRMAVKAPMDDVPRRIEAALADELPRWYRATLRFRSRLLRELRTNAPCHNLFSVVSCQRPLPWRIQVFDRDRAGMK